MKTPVTIFCLSLLLFSCSQKETAPNFTEPVKIKIRENADSISRKLSFICFTEKVYGCSNYAIDYSFSVSANKITIHFTGITVPGICLTSLGPANAEIKPGALADGNYELEINAGQTKVSGQLLVTAEKYQAIIPSQKNIQFVNPVLNRVPANTLFGTVHYHAATTATNVQKFIDSLQVYGAASAIYPTGDYEYFQIESNGQIKQVQDLGYNFTRYFIFNYPGNPEPFKNLVKRFGMANPGLLLITLSTSKGENFYSWTP